MSIYVHLNNSITSRACMTVVSFSISARAYTKISCTIDSIFLLVLAYLFDIVHKNYSKGTRLSDTFHAVSIIKMELNCWLVLMMNIFICLIPTTPVWDHLHINFKDMSIQQLSKVSTSMVLVVNSLLLGMILIYCYLISLTTFLLGITVQTTVIFSSMRSKANRLCNLWRR